VTLAHGAGGTASRALVESVFLPALENPLLAPLGDAAVLTAGGARLALTTDSYVVTPRFFPGGDIGELAVNGTVNDLAMAGATPLALTAGFVLEEGLALDELRLVADSVAHAAAAAGVVVAAGDTKVVEHGTCDGLYVTTAGLGRVDPRADLDPARVRPGDRVIVSGTIADHGVAVLIARGGLALEAEIASDTAPLHELVSALLPLEGALRFLRDPTRGGLATTLNELAAASGAAVVLDEAALPVRPEVAAACEILGIDPLYVANEGKLVAVVAAHAADSALAALRAHPLGRDAAVVGEVEAAPEGLVLLRTAFGGKRVVDMLVGDPLPRIC
jgi:hydrogenase expression/formation protein HypE